MIYLRFQFMEQKRIGSEGYPIIIIIIIMPNVYPPQNMWEGRYFFPLVLFPLFPVVFLCFPFYAFLFLFLFGLSSHSLFFSFSLSLSLSLSISPFLLLPSFFLSFFLSLFLSFLLLYFSSLLSVFFLFQP